MVYVGAAARPAVAAIKRASVVRFRMRAGYRDAAFARRSPGSPASRGRPSHRPRSHSRPAAAPRWAPTGPRSCRPRRTRRTARRCVRRARLRASLPCSPQSRARRRTRRSTSATWPDGGDGEKAALFSSRTTTTKGESPPTRKSAACRSPHDETPWNGACASDTTWTSSAFGTGGGVFSSAVPVVKLKAGCPPARTVYVALGARGARRA